jgi:hypothetical protein
MCCDSLGDREVVQVGKKKAAPPKSVRCKTCEKRIRIPDGWTVGPAVRKHYWKHHREVMQPTIGRGS